MSPHPLFPAHSIPDSAYCVLALPPSRSSFTLLPEQGGWEPETLSSDDTELERELFRVQRRETALQQQVVELRTQLDAAAYRSMLLETQLRSAEHDRDLAAQRALDRERELEQRAEASAALKQAEGAARAEAEDLKRALLAMQNEVERIRALQDQEHDSRALASLESERLAAENKRLVQRDRELEREVVRLRERVAEQEKVLTAEAGRIQLERRKSSQRLEELSEHVAFLRSSACSTPRALLDEDSKDANGDSDGEAVSDLFAASLRRDLASSGSGSDRSHASISDHEPALPPAVSPKPTKLNLTLLANAKLATPRSGVRGTPRSARGGDVTIVTPRSPRSLLLSAVVREGGGGATPRTAAAAHGALLALEEVHTHIHTHTHTQMVEESRLLNDDVTLCMIM